MSEMPITLPAADWNHGGYQPTPIRWFVLHDEEYPVSSHSAEDVAAFFRNRPYGEYGSAHYVTDADSIQHCVAENIAAYHAPNLSFMGSVGCEQDGYARFSFAEWMTNGSKGTIAHTAALCAEICARYSIPARYVNAAQLNAQMPGITSHVEVNHSIYGATDHWDPGYNFPWTDFFNLVALALGTLKDVTGFQRRHGLVADGDPGRATVTKMGDVMRDAWIGGSIKPPAKPKTGLHRFDDCPTIGQGDSDPAGRPKMVTADLFARFPVFTAQHAMNKLLIAHPALVEDGDFGPVTDAAVRRLQQGNRMVVDGIIGRATWTALAKMLTDAKF